MKRILFIAVILSHSISWSQENVIDSLKNELDQFTDYDESYVDVLNELSFEYIKSNPTKSNYYINMAMSLSKELGYEKGLLRSIANKGSSYWVIGLLDEALSYYLLALTNDASNYPLEYVRINNNIGEVFKKKGLFDSAGKYYSQALQMANRELSDRKPVILLTNIAETFLMRAQNDSANIYFQISLKNSIQQQDKRGLAYSYAGLAQISFSQQDINRAIELQTTALALRKEINDVRGIIQSLVSIGTYQIHQAKYDSALMSWNVAERKAVDYKALDLLNEVYFTKYEYYYILGQYKEAADYISQYQLIKDSLQSQEFASSLNRIKGALLSEINASENLLLRQQQIRERSENRARLITIISVCILLFVAVLLAYQGRKRAKLKSEAESEFTFTQSLLKLSKEVNLKQPDFSEFISDFLKTSSKTLNCERASYWHFDKSYKQLVCFKLFQNGRFTKTPPPINQENYPIFFNGIMSNRTLVINDITISEYKDLKLQFVGKTGIKSLIYAALFLDDELIGLISFSDIKSPREWTYAEQRYVGSLADIIVSAFAYNQSKILGKEKEKLIAKLTIRNKSLREFNNVISHNLREPLTQIIGFSDLLEDQLSGESKETDKIISSISAASQKIDSAIKDLSTVLNEKDPLIKDYRQISVDKVLKEVLDLLPKEIEKYKPEIRRNFQIDEVFTYKPFLFDILYHLISNCLKFSIPDKQLIIEVELTQNGNKNLLCFKDNGSGFDAKKFKFKLFKMYQRFHLTTQGRGIGLYLVKNRVTSLGGDVSIISKVNKGTEVKIELPVSPPSINSNSH